jgi:NADPH2:quinone reductase
MAGWKKPEPGSPNSAPGDEVFGMVGVVGGRQGTLAEFVNADARPLAHKPQKLSMRESAVLPLSRVVYNRDRVDLDQVARR